jgi:L-ascorbate metabolism protein UlaG (beta-lactamase superfamily)
VSNFLRNNPEALFVGTPQALNKLKGKAAYSQLLTERLTAFESKHFKHHGIYIEALNFPHIDPKVHAKTQNYAYLIEVNGWKVIHIGDGDINSNRIDGLKLPQRNIDVVLVHDRCLTQKDCAERMKQMNVGKVVFVHMTDNRVKPVSKWIKENLPNADMLVTGHERINISR